jgi:hypothetical protein
MQDIFGRMGFTDQEMVALLGAHAMGRCHTDRSGYWGPWTNAETTFSNEYFRLLVEERWSPKVTHNGKPWTGPDQFEDASGTLMMLPVDIALLAEPAFKKHVLKYAKDEDAFFQVRYLVLHQVSFFKYFCWMIVKVSFLTRSDECVRPYYYCNYLVWYRISPRPFPSSCILVCPWLQSSLGTRFGKRLNQPCVCGKGFIIVGFGRKPRRVRGVNERSRIYIYLIFYNSSRKYTITAGLHLLAYR